MLGYAGSTLVWLLASLVLLVAGCAHGPRWAVECGVVGGGTDRRSVTTQRVEEVVETLSESAAAASEDDPVNSVAYLPRTERQGVPAWQRPGTEVWLLETTSGGLGSCSLLQVASGPSFGDVLKAILAARIESRTGAPAHALAPGHFGDGPASEGAPAAEGGSGAPHGEPGRIRENAYGYGVHADQYGRPGQWVTDQGEAAVGPVEEDVYGPGIGQDPYGRPVRFETLDQ